MGLWYFDGVDDRFTVAYDSTAMDVVPITVCVWVYTTNLAPGGITRDSRYVNKVGSSAGGFFNLTDRNNTYRFRVDNANSAEGGTVPQGQWDAVFGEYDPNGTVTRVYSAPVGGPVAERGVASDPAPGFNTANLTMGAQTDGGNAHNGYLYAVAIFGRLLTPAEKADYVAGIMPANPRLLWMLDTDATSQPSTGAFTNTAVATGPTWDPAMIPPVTYGGGAPAVTGTGQPLPLTVTPAAGTGAGARPGTGQALGLTAAPGAGAGAAGHTGTGGALALAVAPGLGAGAAGRPGTGQPLPLTVTPGLGTGADTSRPTGLTATATSATTIDLAWDAYPAATGYDVERDGAVVATDVAGTTWTDTGRTGDTTYTYRVRAVLP